MENTINRDVSKFLLKLVDCKLPELEEHETTNNNKREARYKEHHKKPTKHQ